MANRDAAAAAEKKRQLTGMTDAFCDTRLNSDYKRLCRKLIDRIARTNPSPLLRGRLDIWAAGIVHAIGSMNFLFDKSFEPYASAAEIAQYFNVSPNSASQKAGQIRDAFDLGPLNLEFATKHMKSGMAPALGMIAQMESLLGALSEAPSQPTVHRGEFIDADHPAMTAYYDLCEQYSQRGPTPALEKSLRKLVGGDSDFYDPYLMLRDVLIQNGRQEEGDALLEEAYRRALARVTGAQGNWPKSLEWGWLENRHIIRTFLNKAISLWNAGDTDAALDLLRKLLRSNPDDNIGAREYILAIRLGMTFDGFEQKFGSQYGYDAMKMIDWFDKNSRRFPEEFGWWKKAVRYRG